MKLSHRLSKTLPRTGRCVSSSGVVVLEIYIPIPLPRHVTRPGVAQYEWTR